MVQTASLSWLRAGQRYVVPAAALLVAGLAWLYLLSGTGTGMRITAMSDWHFPPQLSTALSNPSWTAAYFVSMLSMWFVMMVAMMLPSAVPMLMIYARVGERAASRGAGGSGSPALLMAGYLLAWLAFSLVGTALQWALERAAVLDSFAMTPAAGWLPAVLLLAAGLYQLSGRKAACLSHCRGPVEYLAQHWRKGPWGALRMGVEHGLYCIGCCWLLMGLLFAFGIMNLFWIAGLSLVVLLEKMLPRAVGFSRATGIIMLGSGLFLVIKSVL